MGQGERPDWEPLRAIVASIVDDFMWMFEVELEDGRRLQAYKHYWTRRYLHLDDDGRAFVFTRADDYLEVSPIWALDEVLKGNSQVRGSASGSHETWRNPDGSRAVTIAGRGSDTVRAGTLASIRRATGLEDLR